MLYVGIALAVFVAVGMFVILTGGAEVPPQWLALALFTGFLFWAIIRQSREYWPLPKFWLAITCLLGAHLLAFVAILRAYPEWRPIWFAPIVILEGAFFAPILLLLFGRQKRR
jgi:hypothetical protein